MAFVLASVPDFSRYPTLELFAQFTTLKERGEKIKEYNGKKHGENCITRCFMICTLRQV
jgi:hypothetical protein